MSKKPEFPEWYEKYPKFEDGKKRPIRISKDMEMITTYGVDGNDIISKVFLSTDKLNTSDYYCAPGGYLIPPGFHCNDEIYYVVKGEAIISNPASSQSVRVKEGNAVLIPRGTLHQVFNFGESYLYVLCFIHKQWEEGEWKKLENMVLESR